MPGARTAAAPGPRQRRELRAHRQLACTAPTPPRSSTISDFTARAFPDDPDGNLYIIHYTDYPYTTNTGRGRRIWSTKAPIPTRTATIYFKQTNAAQDDWSDLINMTRVLNVANPAGISDADFLQEAGKVIDIEQFLRYIAVDTFMGNREGGLYSGQGDDYGLYRGINDPRFKLVPWDTDTLTIWGGSTTATSSPAIRTFPASPAAHQPRHASACTMPQLKDLINAVFAPANFNPLVDQVLGGWVPQADRNSAKTWMVNRIDQRPARKSRKRPSRSPAPAGGRATSCTPPRPARR